MMLSKKNSGATFHKPVLAWSQNESDKSVELKRKKPVIN